MTRIHVNKFRLRDGKACIGIEQSGKRKKYARTVYIDGPTTVVYRPEKPLKCGAKAWIETSASVRVRRRS